MSFSKAEIAALRLAEAARDILGSLLAQINSKLNSKPHDNLYKTDAFWCVFAYIPHYNEPKLW